MANLLPGLQACIQNGYNTVRADFLGAPIFDLAFYKGVTVRYGLSGEQEAYDVPDGISITVATSSENSTSSVLLETTSDYDEYFSSSVSGSMSYMSYSASVDSSIAYHGSLFQQGSSAYTVNFGKEQVYQARRNDTTALNANFKAALDALPSTYGGEADREAFFTFFDTYGTHYLEEGIFGGYYTMETRIDESLMESSEQTDVTAGIQAGFEGITSSGSLSVSAAYGSSSFLSQHKSQTSISIYTNGGTPNDDVNTYFQSIYANPILLFNLSASAMSTVQPLSALISDTAKKAAFDSALQDYILAAAEAEGLIASPQPRADKEVYRAASDGFVVATIVKKDDGSRGTVTMTTDSKASPATCRAMASIHKYGNSDSHIDAASLTAPVKAGDYYSTVMTTTSKNPQVTVSFVPLASGGDGTFGDWTSINANAAYTAASSGLVVAFINCPKDDGSRGFIIGQQGSDATGLVDVMSSSAHFYSKEDDWVPCESFCMPVPAGSTYKVSFLITSVSPVATAYWLPIKSPDVSLSKPESRTKGTVYQAETDGFLIGMLNASSDGARGHLEIHVDAFEDDLDAASTVRATTYVHYYKKDNRWVPRNSVMVPITKGSFYKAVYTATSGKPAVTLNWVSVEDAGAGAT